MSGNQTQTHTVILDLCLGLSRSLPRISLLIYITNLVQHITLKFNVSKAVKIYKKMILLTLEKFYNDSLLPIWRDQLRGRTWTPPTTYNVFIIVLLCSQNCRCSHYTPLEFRVKEGLCNRQYSSRLSSHTMTSAIHASSYQANKIIVTIIIVEWKQRFRAINQRKCRKQTNIDWVWLAGLFVFEEAKYCYINGK